MWVGPPASMCWAGNRMRALTHRGCHRPSQACSLTSSRGRQREALALQTRTGATEKLLVLGRWLVGAGCLGESGCVVLHAGNRHLVLCIIPLDCSTTLVRPMRSRLNRHQCGNPLLLLVEVNPPARHSKHKPIRNYCSGHPAGWAKRGT